ncbi:AAA family ATPase [Granulicella arctica]|uniref:AAA family ATPase n=1 Tax=Granulicella arctica TaxID=940613 RepID=UPI0021DF6D1C|nr:MoxR family ATPase [Granulicella arctica]
MFDSPEQALAELSRVGYFTDQKTATTVYLAGKINKPIMLEGPAGAGKTELAQSVARASGAELLRLQCYQGINEEKAIGHYDKSLQELFVLLKTKAEGAHDWDQIRRDVTSRAFFLAGPLLTAIEKEKRCVLLIDEIDKVPDAAPHEEHAGEQAPGHPECSHTQGRDGTCAQVGRGQDRRRDMPHHS